LFRHPEDPLGRDDLSDDYPDRVERIRATLEAWRVERDARAPSDGRLVEPPPGMRARLEALGYVVP